VSVLNHLNERNEPTMVDVGEKAVTRRTAVARAVVRMPPVLAAMVAGGEIRGKKGPVVQTAIVAGIMAAKQTPSLIPMCHPLPLERCDVKIDFEGDRAVIECAVAVHHKTGVEMEALTGATVAALTFYDMCKAVTHAMVIEEVRLVEKRGGKSDVG
jgi:cyclic pyranopterin phosphate synthase